MKLKKWYHFVAMLREKNSEVIKCIKVSFRHSFFITGSQKVNEAGMEGQQQENLPVLSPQSRVNFCRLSLYLLAPGRFSSRRDKTKNIISAPVYDE